MIRDNKPQTNANGAVNPDLVGKSGLDVLEALVVKAARRGLLIMLDYHRMRAQDGISELWWDWEYPESEVIKLWNRLLDRLGRKWNVFAIDLKNEPHGVASWGWQADTDWNQAAEKMIKALAPKFSNLFFVEGVQQNAAAENPCRHAFFWGQNLQGVKWHPIRTGDDWLNRQVVYSPHGQYSLHYQDKLNFSLWTGCSQSGLFQHWRLSPQHARYLERAIRKCKRCQRSAGSLR